MSDHLESIRITFDPTRICYVQLLSIFFQSHDPTIQCSTQYSSAIHTHSEEQQQSALESIREYEANHTGRKVVTRVSPAGKWTDAEEYHQKYIDKAEGKYRKEKQKNKPKANEQDGETEEGKSKEDCCIQ